LVPSDASIHRTRGTKIVARTSLTSLLFLVLVAILPLAAILFYNLYSIRVDKEREVHAEAFRIGQMAALEMQRVLGGPSGHPSNDRRSASGIWPSTGC